MAIIVLATSAPGVSLALAFFESCLGRCNGIEPGLTALDPPGMSNSGSFFAASSVLLVLFYRAAICALSSASVACMHA